MPIYVTVYHLDKMIIGKTEGDVGPFAVVTGGNRERRMGQHLPGCLGRRTSDARLR
jgi:hypothetical protein